MSTSWTTAVGPGDPAYEAGPVNVTPLQPSVVTTIVCTTATLLPGVSSIPFELTDAVLVMRPADVAVAVSATDADCPAVNTPSAHITWPAVMEQLPCDGVAAVTVRPAGIGSTTTTFVAVVAPAFA